MWKTNEIEKQMKIKNITHRLEFMATIEENTVLHMMICTLISLLECEEFENAKIYEPYVADLLAIHTKNDNGIKVIWEGFIHSGICELAKEYPYDGDYELFNDFNEHSMIS